MKLDRDTVLSPAPAFGERIRELRAAKSLTQRELAEAVALRTIGYGRGFSFTYLSKIENRLRRPSKVAIYQLAKVLGADVDELLGLAGRA